MADERRCALPGCGRSLRRSNQKFCTESHKVAAYNRRKRGEQKRHPQYDLRDQLLRRLKVITAKPNLTVDSITGRTFHDLDMEGVHEALRRVEERIAHMEQPRERSPAKAKPFDPTARLPDGRWPLLCGECGAPVSGDAVRLMVPERPNEREENPYRCHTHLWKKERV